MKRKFMVHFNIMDYVHNDWYIKTKKTNVMPAQYPLAQQCIYVQDIPIVWRIRKWILQDIHSNICITNRMISIMLGMAIDVLNN